MDVMNIKHYQKQFFSDEWKEIVKQTNATEIASILDRVAHLMENYIIFNDALDMEACKTPYSITKYKWNDYPTDDPEWTYMLNRHGFMVDLAIAYVWTEEEAYRLKWKEFLFSFISENGVPTEENKPSWRPIDTGIRLTNWLKSLTYLPVDTLSDEEWKLLDEAMHTHVSYLKEAYIDKYRLSNWGVLALSGIAIYDLFFPYQISQQQMFWIWGQIKQQIELQFYADGVHWEQSPLYHHEVIATYSYLLQVAEYLGQKLPIDLRQKLEKPMVAAYYMASSDDYLSPLHDSDYVDFSYVYDIYRSMGFLPPTKERAATLFVGMKYNHQIERELPVLFHGEKSGFSALKNENLYFTLFNGWHGSSHGHATNGSFTLNALQNEVISDSGRYTYTESSERRELKSLEAHNTLFDMEDLSTVITESWGYGQLPLPIHQHAEEIADLPNHFLFSQSWGSKTGKTSLYTRDFVVLEPYGITLIYDAYRGEGEKISATFNFHEQCQVTVKDDRKVNIETNNVAGYLAVVDGTLHSERGIRSNIYNELEQHHRIRNEIQVKDGEINTITILSLDKEVEWETIPFYQNGKQEPFKGGVGLRIKVSNEQHLDFYFLYEDVLVGNKLFKTTSNQFFYGKITSFDDKNQLFKIK